MKKVVLLAINSKYVHSALSVWILKESLRKFSLYELDCRVVESTIQQSCDEIANDVAAEIPDIVGISAYIWNSGAISDIIRKLRERLPKLVIILGGPEALIGTEYWESRGADYVLTGEGEFLLPGLIDGLISSAAAVKEKNEGHFEELFPQNAKNTKNTINTKSSEEPLNPYTDEYFEALGNKIAYIETSRGCPFSCAFCLSGDDDVRFFPNKIAKDRILKLSKSKARTIKFVDRTFNCRPERAYELFEFVINLDTDNRFHFEVAADLFDEKTINLLKKAPPGRIQFESGIQSFCEPALEAVSRKTDLKKTEENLKKLILGKNIHIHVDLIAGLPFESYEEFQRSFNRAFAIGAHTLQLGFLKMLHGSELRQMAANMDMTFSQKPPYEILCSEWLRGGDIECLNVAENALRHTYNRSRFLQTLEYALSVSNMTPFSLFMQIGKSAPNHGIQLENYAERIFEVISCLHGVDKEILCDKMTCDWLGMVKGKNMPKFMKRGFLAHNRAVEIAKKMMKLDIQRSEYALLSTKKIVFTDNKERDPVTSLYKLHYVDYDSVVW